MSRNINPSVSSAGNSYEATRVELTLRQKLWKKKITLIAGGAYEHDNYNLSIGPVSRDDDFWEGHAEINYDVTKWFQFGAVYRYQRNSSTLHTVSFGQNVVTIHALLHF